jgi:Helix-turn-helix domain
MEVNMDKPIRAGEALVLTPAQAQAALQCGVTRLWELINTGEVESFLDGNRRRITAKSIHDYINRRLAAGPAKRVVPPRRGRKAIANGAAA